MKRNALISTFALVGLFWGCGKNSSDAADALNGFLKDSTGDITQDAAALAENQSDTMDELASSLNESGSGGAASSLALSAPSKTKNSGNVTRACTENDPEAGKVTVVLTYIAGQKDSSEKRGRLPNSGNAVKSDLSGTGTLTRVWTPQSPADAVCTNGAHFKFKGAGKNGADLNSTSLLETEDRTRVMSVSKGGKTLTGRTMKTAGTRQVNFSTTTDTEFTYQKEIDNNITRTITLKKPNGTTVERIKSVTTPTKLTVKVKRNATSGELEKKVITAGTIQSVVSAENTKVTTTFTDLTYDFKSTNDNACTPVSGKIAGSTFKADALVKSYEIDFGADTTTYPSGISIKLGDAAAEDCPTCVAAKCDFE
jgi:hypothetical protein